MTKNEILMLDLLKSALWNKRADLSLFNSKDIDWHGILDIADVQGVISLVASAIRQLEDQGVKEEFLPNDIINKCVTLQFAVIQQTSSVIPTIESVVTKIRTVGVEPVLLKGHGVAKYYLKPEFRYCGDIDLYIGKDFVDKVVDCLKVFPEFKDDSHGHEKHYNLMWNNVEVELHRSAIDLIDTRQNKLLYEWTEEELHSNRNRQIPVGNTTVTVPSELFDAIFVFQHLWWHIVNEGIGIRQFCDWTMCLYRVGDKLDEKQLKDLLKKFGLLSVWQIFGHVAVEQLGLPKEKFPLYSKRNQYLGRKITELAMQYGNFGHKHYKYMVSDSVEKGVLKHKMMVTTFYGKLQFWCFLVSPVATFPVIKKYWKDTCIRYWKKLFH